MFIVIKECPLCKSTKINKVIYNQKNIYSFLISKILKKKESFVLEKMYNVECGNCFTIYKKKWLSPKIAKILYNSYVPIHPSCINRNQKNFSKKKFNDLISELKLNIKRQNNENIDKNKREISKIIYAIDTKNKIFKINKKIFLNCLSSNNINKLIKLKKNLIKFINKPKDYSQFAGYGNNKIWKYLYKKTKIKKKQNYAEIGCPSWGMFEQARNHGLNLHFIKYKNHNFFNCKFNLHKSIKIQKLSLKKSYDFLGIYNYIDHVENLKKIFLDIKKISRYIGIIMEPYESNYKIDCQHLTVFQNKTLKYFEKFLKLKLQKKPFKLAVPGKNDYYFYIFKNDI